MRGLHSQTTGTSPVFPDAAFADPPRVSEPSHARLSPLDHPALRWPQHDADEMEAVLGVLASGRVNSLVHGDQCRMFEREFAEYCGVPYAITVSNGTTALELAMRALRIGAGDEVIIPARSFFASAASVVAVGATPVFADIDATDQGIDARSAEAMVTARTRAILCVHLAGWPCNMDALHSLADRHGLYIIEDCAQAHGARYRGRPVGSFGDAAAFSFCTDKIMSTGGEGGMLLLRDEAAWTRAWAYKDHGKNPEKVFGPVAGHGFRYIHDSFGTNWRMTEMQAAIGRRQLAKLPMWLAKRKRNAERLMSRIAGDPRIVAPDIPVHVGHAFYRLYLFLADHMLDDHGSANGVIERMNRMGIPVGSGSCADMSLEHAFDGMDIRREGILTVARDIGRRSIAFPVDHLLDDADMDRIASALGTALSELDPALERPAA